MATIFPSLIGSDLLNLESTIKMLDPHCLGYHIDIMDGNFVPNLSMGPMIVNALAKKTKNTDLWIHLMVTKPATYLDSLELPPGAWFTFHIESEVGILNLIKNIREKKLKPGLAISPKTPIERIFPFLNELDQVTVMSVEPGFSGQEFLKSSIERVEALAAYRSTSGEKFKIAIDGGISENNIALLAQKGVDQFAVSSAIFDYADPVRAFEELKKLIS